MLFIISTFMFTNDNLMRCQTIFTKSVIIVDAGAGKDTERNSEGRLCNMKNGSPTA